MAEGQQEKVAQPAASEATQAHVLEVFNRNARQLEQDNPDVLGIVPDPGNGTIWIVTDQPDKVPTHIGNVPVTIKPAPPHLPPLPGVIILKPGGVQEAHPEMEDCPQDYAKEIRRYRWRFCQSTAGPPETIPASMAPPIAGIPFSEVKTIVERHREELMALPGVTGVGIGTEGIHIETDQPEFVPATVEGLPTKPLTRRGQMWRSTNHTKSSVTTPFHGGIGKSAY